MVVSRFAVFLSSLLYLYFISHPFLLHNMQIDWESNKAIHHLPTTDAVNLLKWNPKRYLLAFACQNKERSAPGMFHIFGFSR